MNVHEVSSKEIAATPRVNNQKKLLECCMTCFDETLIFYLALSYFPGC